MSDMDIIRGWRAAVKMASEEPTRYSTFNDESEFDIHAKKGRSMPADLKALDKLLWKSFRAGQANAGGSILSSIKGNDFSKYFESESNHE